MSQRENDSDTEYECRLDGCPRSFGNSRGRASHERQAHPDAPLSPWQDQETLYQLYVEKGMSTVEIAERLGCGHATVRDWMEKHGIERRDRSEALKMEYRSKKPPWTDAELLSNLYEGEKMTTREVAEELGCTKYAVEYWLRQHDIPARESVETRILNQLTNPVPLHDRSGSAYQYWCHEHRRERDYVYVHRLLAVAVFGFDALYGKEVHHKNGIAWDNRPENIELLSPKEHQRHHNSKLNSEQYEEMVELYESGEVESYAELGRMYGIDPTTAYRTIEKGRNVD